MKLDPGSGIQCFFDPWLWDPYPGTWDIPDHISESLVTILWVNKYFNSLLRIWINIRCLFDPGSRIRDPLLKNEDPGSGTPGMNIADPQHNPPAFSSCQCYLFWTSNPFNRPTQQSKRSTIDPIQIFCSRNGSPRSFIYNNPIIKFRGDVVYLGWPIAPLVYELKCGGSGWVVGSQPVSTPNLYHRSDEDRGHQYSLCAHIF